MPAFKLKHNKSNAMIKTTQVFAFFATALLVLWLSCPALGAGNLGNNGHKTKGGAAVLPDYFLPLDTIPAGRGFDRDLDGGRYTPYQPNPFESKATPPMVIPMSPLSIDSTHSAARNLPKAYTGFKIEIVVVDSLLSPDNELFQRHGNLCVEKITEKSYSYTIGSFQSAPDADDFLLNFLSKPYPRARLIEYRDGKRLN
jgi:hypothetical protein